MSPITRIHWAEQGDAALEDANAHRKDLIQKLEEIRSSIRVAESAAKRLHADEDKLLNTLATLDSDMREVREFISTIKQEKTHEQ